MKSERVSHKIAEVQMMLIYGSLLIGRSSFQEVAVDF
uniref:Uncharacterized protein n=1 Tax=Podoviridae sp. ctG4L18 TaxID=2825234 RepID=A0A8S5UPK3_9CAUD|nr:MAG TPA: hypothetical protein [Podoviridae sp. ctG4L18]